MAWLRTTGLAYRRAMCGVTAYCREVEPGQYEDQFGPIPFVSHRRRARVTCRSCLDNIQRMERRYHAKHSKR